LVVVVAVVIVVSVFAAGRLPTQPSSAVNNPPPTNPPPTPSACPRSVGLCVTRNVTRVIDGDTVDVQGNLRIRLVLVDAPELNATGGPEAKDHLTAVCLGKSALIDEDDNQIGHDPYHRVLAVIYCDSVNANADMISSGLAKTYFAFCGVSEFGKQAWTGCASAPPPPPGNCDPAYPDVCIPPPPPDLDCKDIPYRRFRVLPPDPHHFDSDGDGIGCESGP